MSTMEFNTIVFLTFAISMSRFLQGEIAENLIYDQILQKRKKKKTEIGGFNCDAFNLADVC